MKASVSCPAPPRIRVTHNYRELWCSSPNPEIQHGVSEIAKAEDAVLCTVRMDGTAREW
jgi:hypothetical protein